jgi:hypothetical protein
MTKARKLESGKLPAAIAVAKWSRELYPQSFATSYLLADLLSLDGKLSEAVAEAKKSRALEPHNAATLNLLEKIQSMQEPLRFLPEGMYKLQCRNDQTGEAQMTEIVIEQNGNGSFSGKKTDAGGEPGALRSVHAGGNRLWVVADGGYGAVEFRITVKDAEVQGYWAAPFGRNGTLTGTKK